MSKPTPCSLAAMALVAVAWALLAVAGAQGSDRCDPFRDILVNETAGWLQPDGTKQFDVAVTNEGRAAVRDVHLDCGEQFRSERVVDAGLLVQVAPGDCLLLNGGAIAPGGGVSFTYSGFQRYGMAVVKATCTD